MAKNHIWEYLLGDKTVVNNLKCWKADYCPNRNKVGHNVGGVLVRTLDK